MDKWQKASVIISLLVFIRLIIRDYIEYIGYRKKKRKPTTKKKRQVSLKTKRHN